MNQGRWVPTMLTKVIEAIGGDAKIPSADYEAFESNAYECRALLVREPSGGFSVHALRLPGVISEGETEAEALSNIAEAFAGAISSYLESGERIPWEDVEIAAASDGLERWIVVHV